MDCSDLGVFKLQQLGYRMFIRIMFYLHFISSSSLSSSLLFICNTVMEAAIDI